MSTTESLNLVHRAVARIDRTEPHANEAPPSIFDSTSIDLMPLHRACAVRLDKRFVLFDFVEDRIDLDVVYPRVFRLSNTNFGEYSQMPVLLRCA